MKFNKLALSILICTLLSGCGSDSKSSSDNVGYSEISGLASDGGAIKGQVSINDGTATKTFSEDVINVFDSGIFEIENANGIKYPALIKIKGAHGIEASTEYSLLLNNEEPRVNLSALTRLIVGKVAGIDANIVYNDFETYKSLFTKDAVLNAQREVLNVLEPLLKAAKIESDVNLLSSSYQANFTHIDSVLSTLHIEYINEAAVMTYIPNKEYTVNLPYQESWEDKSFIPAGSDAEQLEKDLRVIHQASEILERMILLKDDKVAFESYLSPNAHWFGNSYQTLHEGYFAILPAEKDPSLKRHRDLVILDSKPEKQQYLIGYTTSFEASTASSVSRDQAWFEYVGGELKFLGDDQAFPTSFYALYKLNTSPKEYNWPWMGSEEFRWVFETTGFLAEKDCTTNLDRGHWQWQSSEFMASLPSLNEVFPGLQHVTVTSPTDADIKFDKVYRDPSDGTCHLVDSQNLVSGLLDGYTIELSKDKIEHNQEYLVNFIYEHATLTKTIYLTQPPENKEVMSDYIATLKELDGQKDAFVYDWERVNDFVVEGDLYVFFPNHEGVGERINIEEGKSEVRTTTRDDVLRIFHTGLDPYGRVIYNYYISQDDQPLK
ncbi:hypothetical protein [Vibrio alfacsensis]|uniref:hypothetical protein n=1 Tax=Vibrio alfacsensis TaxID=1074311 RepID=UPI004068F94C